MKGNMGGLSRLIGTAAILSLAPASAAAQPPDPTPYAVPRSDVRTMTARNGAQYRIMVSWPATPPPATGFPVLYVLDGDDSFAIAAESVTRLGRFSQAAAITPGVIVAIGYPGETRRARDYTPPLAEGASVPPGGPFGGADDFLAFIADELKPAIAHDFSVDPARQAIMGHSYGGLLVLHGLFTRPELFRTWIAASPAIWFGGNAVLANEARFAERVRAGGLSPTLVLTVGELEQQMSLGGAGDPYAARNAGRRMIDNARELTQRLAALEPYGLDVRFRLLSGETHGTSPLPSMGGAIMQAFAAPRS